MKLLKKMKNKNGLLLLIGLLFSVQMVAQFEHYQYLRPIENVTETWHELELPNDLYRTLNRQITDLRIIGVTAEKDTIEVPYLLNFNADKTVADNISFHQLNTTQNSEGYFFTFEMREQTAINQILLNFNNENFDWEITLEGSQNQKEWFTILEDYRLVSFKNTTTNYEFTTLNFPNAQYSFFRLKIPSAAIPKLEKASILQNKTVLGKSKNINNLIVKVKTDKKNKDSVIEIEMPEVSPIIELTLPVETTFDYYRKIMIQALADSTVTPRGMEYFYKTIHRSVLSSLEKNEFKFKAARASKLRITIDNKDNQPLDFGKPTVKSGVYSLTARFNEPADYFLLYGSDRALKPQYDLAQFASTIPDDLSSLSLGNVTKLELEKPNIVKPIFESQWWLWGIMVAIILLLGGFTFKMMTSKKMK
ncbi:MAG: hypothetical protein ACI9XO_003922 [Paraglaciecola sp.]|jgi:hypothetical protein